MCDVTTSLPTTNVTRDFPHITFAGIHYVCGDVTIFIEIT